MCLGDTICATPAHRKIKERYPDYPIDVYCLCPVVFRHNNYYADKVFAYDPAMEQGGYYTARQPHTCRLSTVKTCCNPSEIFV